MNEFGRVSANRRLTLLAEADRLTGELKKKAPPNQLAVLGASFAEIYDYDKAEKYFRMMTDEKNPVSLRVSGLKSIALVEFQKGLASYATSRESISKSVRASWQSHGRRIDRHGD